MTSSPPSFEGFGVGVTATDTVYRITVDPRGRFDVGITLSWKPGSFQVVLPELKVPPGENLFDYEKRAAAVHLDAFDGVQSKAVGQLARALVDMVGWTITVAPDRLVLELREKPNDAMVRRLVSTLIGVARALANPASTELIRLVKGASEAKEAKIRVHCLSQLWATFPSHDETSMASRIACRDPDASVRLFGANALGKEAVVTLRELVMNQTLELSLRLEALHAFCTHAVHTRVGFLAELAVSPEDAVAAVAMDALDRDSPEIVVPLMLRIAAGENEVLAPVAVRKLQKHAAHIARFEPALLEALQNEHVTEGVRFAIVDLLGEIGTAACLPVLNAAMRAMLFNTRYKQALKGSLEQLRERLNLAESAGAVTIAPATGGELSRDRE